MLPKHNLLLFYGIQYAKGDDRKQWIESFHPHSFSHPTHGEAGTDVGGDTGLNEELMTEAAHM